MNRGSTKLFVQFFKIFSDETRLNYLGPIPLLIKFLPSLGVKTKKLAGAITNQSAGQASNLMKYDIPVEEGEEIDPK